MYVYRITNTINGKQYVGLSTNNSEYYRRNYYGSGLAIKKAIKKYGKSNFVKEIVYESDSLEDIQNKEIDIIKEMNDLGVENYNIAKGGETGHWTEYKTDEELADIRCRQAESLKKWHQENDHPNLGKKLSSGQKISKALRGRKVPRDVVEKQRIANTGQKRSELQKINISEAIKEAYKDGFSEDHKENISKALTGRKLSEKTKEKLRKPQPRVVCPYCSKEGGKPVMARYHFENCKQKTQNI